jgi:hypothetical protein
MLNLHFNNLKKKDRFKFSSITQILLTYLICSGIFWAFLSFVFFLRLYDPHYGLHSVLKLTSSFSLFLNSISAVFLLILFSFFIGIILVLPALIIKFLLLLKLIKREKKGQKPIILIFFTKYIPILLAIFINAFFLFYNLSIAPEITSRFLSSNNLILSISKKLGASISSDDSFSFYEEGLKIAKNKNIDSNFIFIFPDDYFNKKDTFIKTKLVLSEHSKLFLTNSSTADLISSLLKIYQPTYYKLYSPLPISDESVNSNKNIVNHDFYIGSTISERTILNNLFNQDLSQENITWIDVFLNKLALSQPQLMYFFKSNLASHFSSMWKWSNIHLSSKTILQNYISEISNNKNNNFKKFIFSFSDLTLYNKINIFNNKNYILYQNKNKANFNTDDLAFSQFIAGLIVGGNKNIYLLTLSLNNENNEYYFYDLYSNKKLNNNIYIPETITENNNNYPKQNKCFEKILNFSEPNYRNLLIDKILFSSNTLKIEKKYSFYIKKMMSESFVCYLDDGNVYYFKQNNDKFSPVNFNYGENFSKIFKIYREKYNNKADSEKIKNIQEKSFDLYLNEFFNSFKIYKISNTNSYLELIPNINERNLFLKKYGDFIFENMSISVSKNLNCQNILSTPNHNNNNLKSCVNI